ncbi:MULTISPECIES: hypothetical protein [Paenibacillus]|uniref:hypothetical protein n=1 Tax=Paenibacillus TaxID=44249 RepID=UPI002FE01DB9
MTYRLKNEHLSIEIAEPGVYRGARFDWTGFITGITLLNGNHTFCVPESLVPGRGTGGAGLCNEFGIETALGYDEIAAGGQFPKLGIGLLTRVDERKYEFFRDYPIRPFDVKVVRENKACLTFHSLPKECNGFAASLSKRISVAGNRLEVAYSLRNTGTKVLSTEEYCHNFLGIDGHKIGRDYVLRFPFELTPTADEEQTMAGLSFERGEVRFPDQPQSPFYFRLPGFEGGRYPWIWELLHEPSGTGVRELSQFPVSKAAVWGEGHVVSPEIFIKVELAPGEEQRWTRIYEFF